MAATQPLILPDRVREWTHLEAMVTWKVDPETADLLRRAVEALETAVAHLGTITARDAGGSPWSAALLDRVVPPIAAALIGAAGALVGARVGAREARQGAREAAEAAIAGQVQLAREQARREWRVKRVSNLLDFANRRVELVDRFGRTISGKLYDDFVQLYDQIVRDPVLHPDANVIDDEAFPELLHEYFQADYKLRTKVEQQFGALRSAGTFETEWPNIIDVLSNYLNPAGGLMRSSALAR